MQRITEIMIDPLVVIVAITLLLVVRLIARDAALDRNTTGLLLLLVIFSAMLITAASPAVVNRILSNLESQFPDTPICSGDYTALVVLGGGLDSRIKVPEQFEYMSEATLARVSKAQKVLALQPGLDYPVILAGGGRSGVSEAEVMATFLILTGAAPERLHTESESANTFANARNVAKIFSEKKWSKSIRLVSSALHMHRAVGVFKKQGFDVCPIPTDRQGLLGVPHYALLPQTSVLVKADKLLHELAGIGYYKLRGWM